MMLPFCFFMECVVCACAVVVSPYRYGMPIQSHHANQESLRLEALKRYQLLDTPAEEVFDDYTRLVSRTLDVPISLISLVDDCRQWFKSCLGWQRQETPREVAFCDYTIQQTKVMVVEDALEDDRFRNNPLVREDPYIRFYAGAPLMTPQGVALGSLCAIDRRPRKVCAEQVADLEALARQLMNLMELRRVSVDLEEALSRVRNLEGLIPMCSYCKKIRSEEGDWEELETYIQKRTYADLTHCICPACYKELTGEDPPEG